MATSDPDLVDEIRSFAQYKKEIIDDSDLAIAVNRAKKHLKLEADLVDEQIDWYGIERQEEALFWTALFFSKVQTGALDAKSISVGAVNEQILQAFDTEWYRKYRQKKKSLAYEYGGSRVTRSARTTSGGSREYNEERGYDS